ncbi:MAG: hypothetical protein WDM92_07270 [Caulobacteraceae bacterium]
MAVSRDAAEGAARPGGRRRRQGGPGTAPFHRAVQIFLATGGALAVAVAVPLSALWALDRAGGWTSRPCWP